MAMPKVWFIDGSRAQKARRIEVGRQCPPHRRPALTFKDSTP
jgi:hypothetical protein